MRDITELPHDLFLIVISHLSPQTCVRCRSVSRRWHHAFTDEANCLLLLRWNFPRCREMRLTLLSSPSSQESTDNLSANLKAELVQFAQVPRVWSSTFAHVARRYHHLNRATARVVEKLEIAPSQDNLFSFWGVAPWNRYLRLNEKTASFHYPAPSWWYSQEDGVLVYPATKAKGNSPPLEATGHIYHVVDLSTGVEFPVPFDGRQKHIRRVRLAQAVLIFEWAEVLPYHQLNDREVVHRHYVSIFDVARHPSPSPAGHCFWTVTFRSEFKLHFLGLPLNRSDRFFSAHTATHYAVYFWQPNRSLYQDDPIEQLAVWDISSPSTYRPSEDPRGRKRPSVERTPSLPAGLWSGKSNTSSSSSTSSPSPPDPDPSNEPSSDLERSPRFSLPQSTSGPTVIRRIAWPQLDFYGLRQRATPQLRNLSLDDRNLYFIEEEHRWADGQHSSLSPPRVHLVRSTGIPIIPSDPNPTPTPQQQQQSVVYGPIYLDSCGADGDVNMSFCRRVAPPTATTVWPPPSTTSLNAASRENIISQLRPSQTNQSESSEPGEDWPWSQGMSSPRHLAPCWRHEDFPYLTVSEMVDFSAGVRVSARHCFMLETLSVHVRPEITVRGTPTAATDSDGDRKSRKGKQKEKVKEVKRTREKEFSFVAKEGDEEVNVWAELLAKGHISGDERWVVGEDEGGRITVVRF